MKFYLTKAAQRAAESGQAPAVKEKVAKASRAADKAPRLKAEKAPTGRQLRTNAKQPDVATAPAVASAPLTAPAPKATPVARAPKPKKGIIAVGGQPRVDLLPLEVRTERKAARNVRRAWVGVAAVVVVVALGVAGAMAYAQSANSSLATAQAATTRLNLQAQKYSKVQTVQNQVDLVDAALRVGGSTDIDWPSYLSSVALTVPSGSTLSAVTVDSASTVQAYAQATSPLEGQRVATLTLTATSTSLPSVPTWLENLTSVKGYEDATAGTVALSDGVYTSTVTLHINKKAFSGAYTKGN